MTLRLRMKYLPSAMTRAIDTFSHSEYVFMKLLCVMPMTPVMRNVQVRRILILLDGKPDKSVEDDKTTGLDIGACELETCIDFFLFFSVFISVRMCCSFS